MRPSRAVWGVGLCAVAMAGVPECHYSMYECINSFNPHFSDLMQRRWDGDYNLVQEVPENQEVYCDLDNWVKRSELCGPCAYTFEFTSGVPAEYIGLQHCIGGIEKSPYIEESNMDIASPYNGREMRVVTHTGGGCSTADYGDANLTDTIAFYNYMVSYGCGGGLAGGARVQRALGNRLSVFMYTFFHALTENEPWRLHPSSKGIEDVVMMQAKASAADLPILRLLHAASGDVRGKIVYHCGPGKARGNPEADLTQFSGSQCPWWFLGPGICRGSPDPAKRLCATCPLEAHDGETGEYIGCLWEPELLPMRKQNSMPDMLDFPLRENVIFIDNEAFADPEHMCNLSNWNVSLVKGRVVCFEPPWRNTVKCSRPDYAVYMQQAGVRAWVHTDGWRVHGVGRNIDLPIGTFASSRYGRHLVERFRGQGRKIDSSTYELEILFEKPLPTVWNDTPAPVVVERQLALGTTTPLLEDPVAIIGFVIIAVVSIALTVKLVTLRTEMRITQVPLMPARGLPLGPVMVFVSASLAVVLATITFVLVDEAGKDAEKTQRDNKDEHMQIMVLREQRFVQEFITIILKSTADSIMRELDSVRKRLKDEQDVANSILPFYLPDQPDNTEANTSYIGWQKRIDTLRQVRSVRNGWRYTTGLLMQVFMSEGWYFDDFGIQNDPDVPMLNGTQDTLRTTDQPHLYPLWRSTDPQMRYEKSVYDPFRRLWWSDLPSEFKDVVDLLTSRHHGVSDFTELYVEGYQVVPMVLASDEKRRAPYVAEITAVMATQKPREGAVVSAISVEELGNCLYRTMKEQKSHASLTHNMTFGLITSDGLIVGPDTSYLRGWSTVDYYGMHTDGKMPQRGFQLFSVWDALQWEFNAYGNFLLSKYQRLDAMDGSGEAMVDTFSGRDHYKGHRTEWMWFPFDGAVGEVGWHVWDAWMECEGGGTSCFRFGDGHNAHGQSLYLDGTGAVRVSPYLTQRVPRVAQRRVGGVAEYQSTLDYYNRTLPWGGVDDVIVTQRNLRPSAEGERWEPVVREKIFYENDYSVSVWVKRTQAHKEGMIFADSLTPDTNFRLYEDGSVVMAIVSYGCRAAPPVPLPVGVWVFVTVTVRFASISKRPVMGYCAVFFDGVEQAQGPMGQRAALSQVTSNYTIGHGFTGHIDDLRVHNQTLSAEQVQELMRTGDARWVPDQQLVGVVLTYYQRTEDQYDKYYTAVAILPQEDVVRNSVTHAAELSAAAAAQDEVTQENMRRQNTATIILVSAIILSGTWAALMLNSLLARPFAQFARDITHVSQVDVDRVEVYPDNASLLREINMMSLFNFTWRAAKVTTSGPSATHAQTLNPNSGYTRFPHTVVCGEEKRHP